MSTQVVSSFSALRIAATSALVVAMNTGMSHACVMKPTTSPSNQGTTVPSQRWRVNKVPSPVPGFVRQELYLNVGLFGPTSPTTCACGFGINGTIPGLVPLDASLVIFDSNTNSQTPYTTFPTLFPNTGATATFNAVNPAGEGLNWFGFSSLGGAVPVINAGNAPVLGPNRTLQLCIRLDVPGAWDGFLKTRVGCVLGAEADNNGVPLPFPAFPHGLDPQAPSFGPEPERIIPTPGVLAVMSIGGILICRRRR